MTPSGPVKPPMLISKSTTSAMLAFRASRAPAQGLTDSVSESSKKSCPAWCVGGVEDGFVPEDGKSPRRYRIRSMGSARMAPPTAPAFADDAISAMLYIEGKSSLPG